MNRIWGAPGAHRFWISKLRGAAVIIWIAALAIISIGLASLAAALLSVPHPASGFAAAMAALVPSVLLDAGVFTLLFKLTPTVPVKLDAAVRGGIITAVFWEIAKFAFGLWVLHAGTYDRVYGPLAAIVILLLWLWVSAMIFLYGAAISSVFDKRAAVPQPVNIEHAPAM